MIGRDVELIDKISSESSKLIKYNINFHSENPKYMYTKIDELKLAMLKKATRNARERADMLVEGSANKVGGLRSARQGVFQITSEHSTNVSGYGVFDTSTINKVIKAIVTIEYTID